MNDVLPIKGADPWVKVVDMLQQNWASIEPSEAGGVSVWFYGDTSYVFDRIDFATELDAQKALRRNGFSRFAGDPELQSFLCAPEPPFRQGRHPNGPIYSSGRYWR
jgi:hypothetical protein